MKAVVQRKYGSPKNLIVKDIEKPIPKSNEVLIKVYSTTVNRTDSAMLWAKPKIIRLFIGLTKPKKKVTGTDFAGEIVAKGKGVSAWHVGDRVFGFDDMVLSSHAEYVLLKSDKAIANIPDGVSYDHAVAAIEGSHYARNMINKVRVKPGLKVLVNGATGAIGSACLQLAKHHGMHVTAVCNGLHFKAVSLLGADDLVDYTEIDFTTQNNKYTYVFDCVGKSTFSKCMPILEDGGVYVSSELGKNGVNLLYSLLTPLFFRKKVKFPFPSNIPESLSLLTKLLVSNSITSLIDREYDIENIVDAYEYVGSGEKIGSVLLKPNN